jgi:hypothetical protein
MSSIFIPSSIRDKATRDVLSNIIRSMGGNTSLYVRDVDPSSDETGVVGDIIYSNATDTIWIFTGTVWEKSKISEVHTIGINSVTYGAVDTDPSGWPITSDNFRNNAGTTKALVATLYIDNTARSFADHNTYSYVWRKNGIANFTSTTTQRSDTGQTSRALLIDATDIADQGEDAFTCELTYP